MQPVDLVAFLSAYCCFSLIQHLLHRTLGSCLILASPPADQTLAVLNEVWKAVMKLKHPGVSGVKRSAVLMRNAGF